MERVVRLIREIENLVTDPNDNLPQVRLGEKGNCLILNIKLG